jgi:hypothetical protein
MPEVAVLNMLVPIAVGDQLTARAVPNNGNSGRLIAVAFVRQRTSLNG